MAGRARVVSHLTSSAASQRRNAPCSTWLGDKRAAAVPTRIRTWLEPEALRAHLLCRLLWNL